VSGRSVMAFDLDHLSLPGVTCISTSTITAPDCKNLRFFGVLWFNFARIFQMTTPEIETLCSADSATYPHDEEYYMATIVFLVSSVVFPFRTLPPCTHLGRGISFQSSEILLCELL